MENRQVLPRSVPEAQGISSTAIADFLKAVHKQQTMELHSFMLVRHGHVAAEGWWSPYAADLPHAMYSLSKSFTSTAIGLAVGEGLLTLDDRVVSFFPVEAPREVSPNLSAMQIRHLLMMGTGHSEEPRMREHPRGNWVEAFLHAPVEHEPGTHFVYNSAATYMLSAILQKVSGEKLLDYLQPRLMQPLDIIGATWEACPMGIHFGGWGLNITTEDIAKFGQLYLQKGVWNGRRILSEAWVEEATSKQISNNNNNTDWAQGYGYQFWRCRHGAYRGDGYLGQFCIVMPEQDAVVAFTSGTSDMQAVLNLVWELLLPAMQPGSLPANDEAASALKAQLEGLAMNLPREQHDSPREQTISGKVFKLDDNGEGWNTFSIRFNNDEAAVVIQNNDGEHAIRCGRGVWVNGASSIRQGIERRIASSFTWRDPDTLELTFRIVETPFGYSVVCRMEDEGIVLGIKQNVGAFDSAPIRGKA
ncbi:serine hydrolase [Paenibacillus filicis]|uniref:Serine hydrolase n=1 Tax=Paenibacillus gyeongsangnamensis TaxID=3388067 RepID=A0ABT4QJP7_9BACL|nr:serine hydrolase [Paenibacillus filicis]MCZ8516921.1 serine hydrolase [Paenibacillus filicis]